MVAARLAAHFFARAAVFATLNAASNLRRS